MLIEAIPIVLDKERSLRLCMKGILEFEKLTGKSLLKQFSLKDFTLEELAQLTWACLIHEDKELTYDDALCLIDLGNLDETLEALRKCLQLSLDAAKGGKADVSPLPKKPKPRAG